MNTDEIQYCDTCIYWEKTATIYGASSGCDFADCRRYPPTRIVVDIKTILHYDADDGDNARHTSVFPKTCEIDWCGEWKRRELAVVPG